LTTESAAPTRWQGLIRPAFYLSNNKVTLAGAVLTTSSAIVLIGFWLRESMRDTPVHPYAGILFFMVLPAFFVLGLVLMPLGALWRRRQLRRRGDLPALYPTVDLNSPFVRNAVVLVTVATVLNVAILGTASYRGVEYMDSKEFCGQACHTVMAPEYAAYLGSPHSRVACTECHIGPGASWFVKSKLSGARQVIAVARKTYSRPIASPVHQLRPARETCEHCHWPEKFVGDRVVVRHRYQEDEANTRVTTVLVMKLGGFRAGAASGIHGRHLSKDSRIEYETADDRRQVITRVKYVDDAGKEVVFAPEGAPAGEPKERRSMDCVDCHNRPTHAFEQPNTALDKALTDGRISRTLPWTKKKGMELLQAKYADQEQGKKAIADGLAAFYQKEHAQVWNTRKVEVEAAGQALAAIYARNVFPSMNVQWGTHPNNVGHTDFPGCFRCHDDLHKSADGRVIKQDCESCHAVLAMEEENPKVLADLGLQ
jgi:nitrate/TMAO reductase-like tetraheme cytochrome c subunit